MILVAFLETKHCSCDVEYEIQAIGKNILVRCPQCSFSEVDRGNSMTCSVSVLAPIAREQILRGKIDFSIYCAKEQ